MQQMAEVICHGAVTVVNALAGGKGAALGIDLATRARVKITNRAGQIMARNLTNPAEDETLVLSTVQRIFRRHSVLNQFGAIVETRSNIPIAVGLKSSSSASNAVSAATLKAIRQRATPRQIIDFAVEGSFAAGVTKTGAYDDACACYYGGLVITDNVRRKILKRFAPDRRLHVLIHVPRSKSYTKNVDTRRLESVKRLALTAHRQAMKGNYWFAMTLNGFACSTALGYSPQPAELAIEAGAVAAGLSGKGPAVAAIVPASRLTNVRAAWHRLPGRILDTSLNFEKAHSMVSSRWK